MLNTAAENAQFCTAKQLERAKVARKLFQRIGTPSIRDFKGVVRMNMIGNNPVTVEDINIAEKVYGKDIGALKGKTTRTVGTSLYELNESERINNK